MPYIYGESIIIKLQYEDDIDEIKALQISFLVLTGRPAVSQYSFGSGRSRQAESSKWNLLRHRRHAEYTAADYMFHFPVGKTPWWNDMGKHQYGHIIIVEPWFEPRKHSTARTLLDMGRFPTVVDRYIARIFLQILNVAFYRTFDWTIELPLDYHFDFHQSIKKKHTIVYSPDEVTKTNTNRLHLKDAAFSLDAIPVLQ